MESLISPRFLWRVFPRLRPWLNRKAIERFAGCTPPRPRTHSLWSHVPVPDGGQSGPVADYTSWPGLTDRSFWSRHLPPAPAGGAPPPNDDPADPVRGPWGPVTSLFERPAGRMRPDRSSVLFMFFAQWFTDSLLRVDPTDRRKNRSNHDIDLCQIYGQTERQARLLRTLEGGLLKSQRINGEEYPAYLLEPGAEGLQVRPEFEGLIDADALQKVLRDTPPEHQHRLYATGLERGNSSIGYVCVSTLFLREHNRICLELSNRYGWEDEQLFQTARMINTVLLIRILIEDYINHINGYKLFALDISFAERKDWYRANWMAVEFDLLYRWHALVPDAIEIRGREVPAAEFRNNNELLESLGVGTLLSAASSAPAGQIGMFNTPTFLLGAEFQAIKMGRDSRLCSFNDYRERFSLPRLTSFAQLTQDRALQERLIQLYGTIERLELFIGLFAEQAEPGELFGQLMRNMVAYDAFTQILSNPLLARCVFTPKTFSEYGYGLIMETSCLQDLVRRHFPAHVQASFAAQGGAVAPLMGRRESREQRAAAE